MNGVILVNKNKNVTSRDIVNDLVHIFNTKKIGHTGTLDPIASGVLVCTIGKYTKLNDVLTSKYKEYIATMELGYLTDTLDNTGTVLSKSEDIPNEDRIREVVYSFQKKYMQEVPIYSSVKVNLALTKSSVSIITTGLTPYLVPIISIMILPQSSTNS